MPLIEFDSLLACLEIESSDRGRYALSNLRMDYPRIFGGQLIAQAIMIATHSTSDSPAPKAVKSIHTLLPRAGDMKEPVEWQVEKLHDGRSFAGRSVVGCQFGEVIVSTQVSLHVQEEGPEHQIEAPRLEGPSAAAAVDLSMIPWETRSVGGVDLESREVGPPDYALWMRAPSLPDPPPLHQALLAHASTLNLIGTALRPHEGLGQADAQKEIATAVTSHTLWFHRPLRIDQWLLLHQQSPISAGARGFGLGHVFSSGGELLASFAQECLMRPNRPGPLMHAPVPTEH